MDKTRVLILTTETAHHAFYTRELSKRLDLELFALIETTSVEPKFETGHPFEAQRDAYEAEQWFAGPRQLVRDFAPAEPFANINQPEALEAATRFAPDLVFVFGTRKLNLAIIHAFPDRLFNFHSGDPERYRGLDSHLWAIQDGDFASIKLCMHRVDVELDVGEIVCMEPVPLRPDMDLYQLRKYNTDLCPGFSETAIDQWQQTGMVASRPQRAKGVYKSFMPAGLKQDCVIRFGNHVRSLS